MTATFPIVSSVCNSAPGSGPSSPNSSHSTIAENGFTGSVPNISTEVQSCQGREGGPELLVFLGKEEGSSFQSVSPRMPSRDLSARVDRLEGPIALKWDMPHGPLKGCDFSLPKVGLGVGSGAPFRALGLGPRWPPFALMPVSLDCFPDAPPAPGPPSGQFPQPVQPLHVTLSAQHLLRATGHSHCHQLTPHCKYGHTPHPSLVLSTLVLDAPTWGFCPPKALREIIWLWSGAGWAEGR